MKLTSLEAIFRVLNDADVRYLVVGGLAVNAHGYLRFTNDVDLVVALEPGNIIEAFRALGTLGYKPLVPITAEQFANSNMRQQWIDEKGMQVLNFFSDQYRETTLDVFVYEPFDFETEYSAAMQGELHPGFDPHERGGQPPA